MFNGRYTADGFEYNAKVNNNNNNMMYTFFYLIQFETIEVYLLFEHGNNIYYTYLKILCRFF